MEEGVRETARFGSLKVIIYWKVLAPRNCFCRTKNLTNKNTERNSKYSTLERIESAVIHYIAIWTKEVFGRSVI
ncbi:hypothetical protein CDAR_299031 [Caerostris darwini]|uniref:Uncharacterized protein n=1 Tax=Caerostris darwini TaxID=1538125 RepID=A0AAV4PBY0_9ARAC|nr:hypothetical protein CDAR_299031 [Caerostris darwini]